MKKEKSPAFQFYPKDWLSDLNVLSMTLEERGIYIHLLCICWLEGYIPNDPKRVSIMLGLHADYTIDECNHRWEMVKRCFEPHPNDATKLIHLRLEKERKKQSEWREKSAKGGVASAKSRKKKALSGTKGGSMVVDDCLQPKSNISFASSSSSSSSLKPKNIMSGKPDQVREVLDYLNQKSGRSFHDTPKHRSLIKARFKEGYSLDDFKRVIDNMVLAWGKDGEMAQYIRPPTLFSGKFDSYLNKPSAKDTTKDPPKLNTEWKKQLNPNDAPPPEELREWVKEFGKSL